MTASSTASFLGVLPFASFSMAYRFDALADIAAATGGERLGGSNRPDRLLAAESTLLGRRFRIGFTPPDQGSIRREIRVEVSRPGVTVRTAGGQRTLTGEEAAHGRFAALLLTDATEAPDFAIELKALGDASARPGEVLHYDVVVPLSEIFLARGPKTVTANMEVLVAAIDGEGRTSQLRFEPISLRIPDDQAVSASRSVYRYSGRVTFDHFGKGRLWVGIRDRATNRLGYADIDFEN